MKNLSITKKARPLLSGLILGLLVSPWALAIDTASLPALDAVPDAGYCDTPDAAVVEILELCAGCSVANIEKAADGDETSYALITFPAGLLEQTLLVQANFSNQVLSAPNGAIGVLAAEPREMIGWKRGIWSVSGGQRKEGREDFGYGATRNGTPVFYARNVSSEFDAMEFAFTTQVENGGELHIYEFCLQ